jgi:hypothetical protein
MKGFLPASLLVRLHRRLALPLGDANKSTVFYPYSKSLPQKLVGTNGSAPGCKFFGED